MDPIGSLLPPETPAAVPDDGKAKAMPADRGYDADAIRAAIALHGIQAVIPAKRGRNHPRRTTSSGQETRDAHFHHR